MVMTVPGYTPPVTRATFRRSAIAAACVAVAVCAVLFPLGYGAWALFGCAGIGLGVLNSYLTMRAVISFAQNQPSRARFSASVLGRLGLITLIAFAIVLLFPQKAAIAVFGGLIVFQFLGIASSLLPLIKEIRQK